MYKFKLDDYGDFNNAISTTKKMNEALDKISNEVTTCKSKLSAQDIFMGPICDQTVEALESLFKNIEGKISNYNTFSEYIDQTLAEYKNADNNAVQKILTINDQGQLEIVDSGTAAVSAILSGDYLNPANLSGSKLEFIQSIIDGAVSAYNKYGVLPSLTLAQAILETGWGEHKIGNNIFGIKARESWTGKTKTVTTKEWEHGHYKTIKDTFRDYDSIAESIEDHAKLLTNDRYKPVLGAKNYKEACKLVKQCGYATSPTYTKSLTDLVEQYGLDQYDPKKA